MEDPIRNDLTDEANRELDGKDDVREAALESSYAEEDGASNLGNTLYLSGLSNRTREEDLEREFSKYGRVVDCSIVRDPRTGESRRFGFLTMETTEGAENAIVGMNGVEINERNITVEKSRRSKPRESTPGRYAGAKPPRKYGDYYRARTSRDRYYDRYRPYDRYARYDDYYDRAYDYRGGYPSRVYYDEYDRYAPAARYDRSSRDMRAASRGYYDDRDYPPPSRAPPPRDYGARSYRDYA